MSDDEYCGLTRGEIEDVFASLPGDKTRAGKHSTDAQRNIIILKRQLLHQTNRMLWNDDEEREYANDIRSLLWYMGEL